MLFRSHPPHLKRKDYPRHPNSGDEDDSPDQGSQGSSSSGMARTQLTSTHSMPPAIRMKPDSIPDAEWDGMNKRQRKEAIQKAREKTSYAAVARTFNPSPKRAIIEFCCSETSKLGEQARGDPDCQVFRLTMKEDMTTESGLAHAVKIVDNLDPETNILLWASLPCIAGSPWQRLNQRVDSARERIDRKSTRLNSSHSQQSRMPSSA